MYNVFEKKKSYIVKKITHVYDLQDFYHYRKVQGLLNESSKYHLITWLFLHNHFFKWGFLRNFASAQTVGHCKIIWWAQCHQDYSCNHQNIWSCFNFETWFSTLLISKQDIKKTYSISLTKKTFFIYLQPITDLINCSLSQGFFPDTMKIAKVVPVYKSGDTMNISNYRLVSILPVFSKILERVLHDRLFKFINKHKIVYNLQVPIWLPWRIQYKYSFNSFYCQYFFSNWQRWYCCWCIFTL